jgi:hypothetical protein
LVLLVQFLRLSRCKAKTVSTNPFGTEACEDDTLEECMAWGAADNMVTNKATEEAGIMDDTNAKNCFHGTHRLLDGGTPKRCGEFEHQATHALFWPMTAFLEILGRGFIFYSTTQLMAKQKDNTGHNLLQKIPKRAHK